MQPIERFYITPNTDNILAQLDNAPFIHDKTKHQVLYV